MNAELCADFFRGWPIHPA